MKKLQGLLDVLEKMNVCIQQCEEKGCPNTTVWYGDKNQSTKDNCIVNSCDFCGEYVCLDHTIADADITVCQSCSVNYWKTQYQDMQQKYKEKTFILEEVCDMTNTSIDSCYDQTCNKTYINSGKANSDSVLDGSKVSNDSFHICDYCEKGYCTTHYNLLIPSIDNKSGCSICGYSDVSEPESKPESKPEICDNCNQTKPSVAQIYLGEDYTSNWCSKCQDILKSKSKPESTESKSPTCTSPPDIYNESLDKYHFYTILDTDILKIYREINNLGIEIKPTPNFPSNMITFKYRDNIKTHHIGGLFGCNPPMSNIRYLINKEYGIIFEGTSLDKECRRLHSKYIFNRECVIDRFAH